MVASKESILSQYRDYVRTIEEKHGPTFVFFRLGDFFELFFSQASRAAEQLNLTLTSRGSWEGKKVPMCGVPSAQLEVYVSRLVAAGKKVAVVDQVETPEEAKARGAKMLRRDLVRIYTAGTIVEENLLPTRESHHLVVLVPQLSKGRKIPTGISVAFLDISAGEFGLEEVKASGLATLLGRLHPAEIIFPESSLETSLRGVLRPWQSILMPLPDHRFDLPNAEKILCESYGLRTTKGLGVFTSPQLQAAAMAVDYVQLTHVSGHLDLPRPKKKPSEHVLRVDAHTCLQLEIRTTQHEDGLSLLETIDRTQSAFGFRLLSRRLETPTRHVPTLEKRLDLISFFLEREKIRDSMRKHLRGVPDGERALGRLAFRRSSVKDLHDLRATLERADFLKQALRQDEDLPAIATSCLKGLGSLGDLVAHLGKALDVTGVHIIRPGFDASLDALRRDARVSRERLTELEEKYRLSSGIPNLKVSYNNILGYFVEVGKKHSLPPPFVHAQSTLSSHRYRADELQTMAQKLDEKCRLARTREGELLVSLEESVRRRHTEIQVALKSMAHLDVALALAQLACERTYVRPTFHEDTPKSSTLCVEGGRHPMVERALEKEDRLFTPNDCKLDHRSSLLLLTGPNMAGKSTYLRQIALLAYLAHIGSFVPAKRASFIPLDSIMCRIGASDDLARGLSTFMMEMTEVASILNQATPSSLVIVDEVGRGTGNDDGLAIAQATLEALAHRNRCPTLFATHFHPLTHLSLSAVVHMTMEVSWKGKNLVFHHRCIPGIARESFGLYVAKMAGVPKSVEERAGAILQELRKPPQERISKNTTVNKTVEDEGSNQLLEDIRRLPSVDDLSPRQAWRVLADLQHALHRTDKKRS